MWVLDLNFDPQSLARLTLESGGRVVDARRARVGARTDNGAGAQGAAEEAVAHPESFGRGTRRAGSRRKAWRPSWKL